MSPSRTRAGIVRMGIHGSFCPKLQPRASQSNDENQNLDPAIGLSALFEVE
jgi:hypothetical protein